MSGRWIAAGLAASLASASPVIAAPDEQQPQPPPPTLEPPPPPPLEPEVDPANYRMVLAGNVVIGLGGAGLIAMAVGLGIRSDAITRRQALGLAIDRDPAAIARQDRRIETATILAISGGAATAALFASGITLVALGYSRERKRREALRMSYAPLLGRDRLGLSWQLRF
ncbi:MAG: hypothetical protein R6X02_25175 [Enhygromyxa sp.]